MFLSDCSLRNSGHDDGHWSRGTFTSQNGKGSLSIVVGKTDSVLAVVVGSRSESFSSMAVNVSADIFSPSSSAISGTVVCSLSMSVYMVYV